MSDDVVAVGSSCVVELWARQEDPQLSGLNCVFSDLSFDSSVLSCNGIAGAPGFNFGATGSCEMGGLVDEVGGCTFSLGTGIVPQWVRIATVDMTAVAVSSGSIVVAQPAGTPVSVILHGNVPVARIGYGMTPSFCVQDPNAPIQCAECLDSADCDDGIFCNGSERCIAGVCVSGGDPCGGTTCDEALDLCPDGVPSMSSWGSIVMILVLLTAGTRVWGSAGRTGDAYSESEKEVVQ